MGQNRHSLPLSVQLATCNSPWMTECLSFDWVKKVLVKVNQDEAFHCFYAAVHFKFFQNSSNFIDVWRFFCKIFFQIFDMKLGYWRSLYYLEYLDICYDFSLTWELVLAFFIKNMIFKVIRVIILKKIFQLKNLAL